MIRLFSLILLCWGLAAAAAAWFHQSPLLGLIGLFCYALGFSLNQLPPLRAFRKSSSLDAVKHKQSMQTIAEECLADCQSAPREHLPGEAIGVVGKATGSPIDGERATNPTVHVQVVVKAPDGRASGTAAQGSSSGLLDGTGGSNDLRLLG